jgi:hypothetical protein
MISCLLAMCIGGSGGTATAQFETRASVPVLSSPYSIAVGDFNKDGKLDVAVVAFTSGGIAVLLGNGDGTFQKPVYYGPVANQVIAADLRNVGTLDLVLATQLSDSLSVMLGNGDGTFGNAQAYPIVGQPWVIGVGDFTGDGILDVVMTTVGSRVCGCVEVLPGNGDGTFGDRILTLPEMDTSSDGIAVGRFSADGNLDIAISGSSQVEIYIGNGDGTFTLGNTYVLASAPGSIATTSFRGNGKLDLAVGLPFSGEVAILLGNGDGTFDQGANLSGSFASAVQTGDFNGDGKPDVVILTGFQSSFVTTFLGNGDGTFQPGISYPIGGSPSFVGVGDFNGDRKQDLAVTDYSQNSVITLLNTSTVSFSPTTPLNFKKQAVGTTSAAQKVRLTNSAKTDLKISSMTASAQFGMTSTCGKSILAGASCTISVTFSPTSQGAKSGTVTINDSASSRPQVIELSGTGT